MGDQYTHWFTENITLSNNGNFYCRLSLMNSAISNIVVREHSSKCMILVSTILYHWPVRIQSETFLCRAKVFPSHCI